MTLEELTDPLPWGLHDARLETLEVDWLRARLTLTARLMMSEHQDLDQRARFTLDGLVYCSIEAPEIDPGRGYEAIPPGGLMVSEGTGAAPGYEATLPPTPQGCFLHWFFVVQWNRFIHVCARDARLTWLDPSPVAARAGTRALFPGDELPDPERTASE